MGRSGTIESALENGWHPPLRLLTACHAALLGKDSTPRAYFRRDHVEPTLVRRLLTSQQASFMRLAMEAQSLLPCPPSLMPRAEREALATEVEALISELHGAGELYYDDLRLTPFASRDLVECEAAWASLASVKDISQSALRDRSERAAAARASWVPFDSPLSAAIRRGIEMRWEKRWNRAAAYLHHGSPSRAVAVLESAGFGAW